MKTKNKKYKCECCGKEITIVWWVACKRYCGYCARAMKYGWIDWLERNNYMKQYKLYLSYITKC